MLINSEISILNIGIGNPVSVLNILKNIGLSSRLISSAEEIRTAQRLIIPGVGHFGKAIDLLKKLDLIGGIKEHAYKDKPILGICLGMQLLCNGSEEGGAEGLGLIDADVVKFKNLNNGLKIPNMGWREVNINDQKLKEGYEDIPRFYFTHSYYAICNKLENQFITADYGITYAAGIAKGNTFGFQFHPEKSHYFGKQLLENLFQHNNAS